MKKTIILASFVVLITAGVGYKILKSGTPEPEVQPAMRRMLAAQQQMPLVEVRAIQALRVLAAVESAYFTQHQTYASPDELKSSGMLDPAWPQVDQAVYQIDCAIGQERLGFQCHADPVQASYSYYFVDPSLTVRFEKGRRADENSPVFGLTKENQ